MVSLGVGVASAIAGKTDRSVTSIILGYRMFARSFLSRKFRFLGYAPDKIEQIRRLIR